MTARRAVAVEACAAKQLAERDARAKGRAEAAAARGGAQGGGSSRGTTSAADEPGGEDACEQGGAGQKRSGRAA